MLKSDNGQMSVPFTPQQGKSRIQETAEAANRSGKSILTDPIK
jgi:hypothetical protein